MMSMGRTPPQGGVSELTDAELDLVAGGNAEGLVVAATTLAGLYAESGTGPLIVASARIIARYYEKAE